MAVIPMFLLLAVVGAVPVFFYLKHLDTADRSTKVTQLTKEVERWRFALTVTLFLLANAAN
jgi:hypothetical protein